MYDRNIEAITALKNGQIDGIVVDSRHRSTSPPFGHRTGRSSGGSRPARSTSGTSSRRKPLRECVNEALAALHADGTIEQLQDEWINASHSVFE